MDVVRGPAFAPGGPATMPPPEGGRVDAAKIWQDAISGRGKEPSWADTQAAATSWLQQPFVTAEERARKDALKAIVPAAQIDRAADVAAGVSPNERQVSSDAELTAKVEKAIAAARASTPATPAVVQAAPVAPAASIASDEPATTAGKSKRKAGWLR